MSTSKIVIRPEQREDGAAVRRINELAFGSAAEADLVDALRAGEGSLSLVAAVDGRVAGHILFTPVTTDPASDVPMAALAPMAVTPDDQRGGIGSALVRAGLEACLRAGYAAVVVVGHPEYYPRFGFRPAGRSGLRCEFDVPADVFMIAELDPGALARIRGVVRYRPEFAAAS